MKVISKLLPASKMKLVISSIGILALVIFSTLVVMEATKAEVVVMNDGEKETVTTHANTVDELLNEVGIIVDQHDAISHTGDTEIKDGMKITYKQSTQVTVTIDGHKKEYYTFAETIGAFLNENNLTLSNHDEVSHKPEDKIVDGLELRIQKAFKVVVNVAGKEKKFWTTGGTVEQLLNSNNIKLNDPDKMNVNLKDQVNPDKPINIVRVDKTEVEVEEAVAFETERKEDGSLAKGEERVVAEGKEGTVVKTYKVIKENGKEVSRKLIHEEVIEESKARVIAIGTKEQQTDLVTLASTEKKEPEANGKVLYMSASAYTANCSGCSGYTATGINLNANPGANVIAVDPSVIPLGTHVYIQGYGEYVAADTGGHIHGKRIDMHFASRDAALAFGRRTVKVTILN
ncbi:ubiquitin-like domain-containing protein [Virgibacillus necropolis]|uniref:ubiquitin-like domain-containing protein n=1 Tax=Virgibacillus necropolis TaxID=163877 RepID=UPI00384C4C64